ncbi:MAG: ABC transporter permease [Bacilli bacterium]|nr:ABC transporter permease [Bacilli bacterium]
MKTLFKNKPLIFWTFAFPLILGTLFSMAFSDIEKEEQLKTIPIAIVKETSNQNSMIINIFEHLKTGEEPMFQISYEEEKDAKALLENKKIDGYLILSEPLKLIVKENGINQTILKFVTEEIIQTEEVMKNVVALEIEDKNMLTENLYQSVYLKLEKWKEENQIELVNISNKNLSYTMIEFYTLIAMTCLYGGILGLYLINQNLANQSANGKRISVSPTLKGKVIITNALAGYTVQLIGIALLFFYTICFLKIDYGENIFFIVLLTLIGCFAGLSLGIMIASVFKTNENTKTGIVIAFTMLCCFLSGMMGITMKYMVDKNIPILNQINPASMITDGFYSLYYYDTLDRYYFNIFSLCIFSILMLALSIRSLRRQTYDSI